MAESHSCICFWRAASQPRLPAEGVCRLRAGWSEFRYQEVPAAAQSLGHMLAESATAEAGKWLLQRNIFLVLSGLFLILGVAESLFGNGYGLVALALSVFWATLVRYSANKQLASLHLLESRLQAKVPGIAQTYLGTEWSLELGSCMQWLCLEQQLYQPPS